jgi:predicted alpha-1,2-mannosidase
MWMQFPPGTTSAELRIALSHVDAEGARNNHREELEGQTFDEVREKARAAWQEQLGGVRVRGGTHEERVVFHTALYHAALWPNVFSDVDGRYRGLDDVVRHAEFLYHSNFSMWDTFRTTHPWFTLVQPQKSLEFAQSLAQMAQDGGDMPRWPLGHGFTGGMVGSPASQILAGTWLKGVRGWDAEEAFESSFRQATEVTPHVSRTAIELYRELGYVPLEASSGSTSLGLEYAWNDAALALWGASLGYDEEAELLSESAGWWRNNWDSEQGFMLGRSADGSFREMADPDPWTSEFVEGNAWHYRWPAPFDVDGMVDLQYGGSLGDFGADYELYWSRVEEEEDDVFPDTYYWHGNEPDIHHAWLGSLAGLPESTLHAVRLLMSTRYDTSPSGLDGNDDAGTLSSWYLFAASGLYPVAGTTQYAVTLPLFSRVEFDRPDGMLVLENEGDPNSPVLPVSPLLGDEELGAWIVEHDRLIEQGTLRFLGPE